MELDNRKNDMKITKKGNVIIELTDRENGMLVQGGICGRKLAYDAVELSEALDCTLEELERLDWDDWAPKFQWVRVYEVAEYNLTPRVLFKGVRIQ